MLFLLCRSLLSLCGVPNLWALAVAERSRDCPIWEPSSTSLCLQRMMWVVQSVNIVYIIPECGKLKSLTCFLLNALTLVQTLFFFFLDQSRRQVLLWPSHHHGEHESRQPVIAALSGVCKGKFLLDYIHANTCVVNFEQCIKMINHLFFRATCSKFFITSCWMEKRASQRSTTWQL